MEQKISFNKAEAKRFLYKLLEEGNGILRLKPTWVAREDCISANRLGLKEEETKKGLRGEITERWLASAIKADNRIGPDDEGISYIYTGNNMTFSIKDALDVGKELILGEEYSKHYSSFGVLVKVIDFADRIFYHYHQRINDAVLVSRNPKEESYYFPQDSNPGIHPETFFGVHPYIYEQKKFDIILPYLVDWNSDLILKHSRAYIQAKDDGFHLPAGIPHSPGTALTIEIQEESDVSAALQALYRGKILPKDKLFHDIRMSDREKYGEKIILKQIDWEKSGDPYFYENRHTPPIMIINNMKNRENGQEYWIFYNTNKYSGKKLIVYPGKKFESIENGVHSIIVWKGKGKINGSYVEGKKFNFDELVVSHYTAKRLTIIENSSDTNLELYKFFGPGINPGVPMLPFYSTKYSIQ